MAINRKPNFSNPFVTLIDIPNEYFCDRETETAKLISHAFNGNNTVLTAQRRIGKSSLLKHVLIQPEVTQNFNTLYVDIYQTKNMEDFIREFSKALLNSSFAKGERAVKKITDAVPEIKLYAQLKAGPVTAGMETAIKTQGAQTLDKIFKFLENTQKPNIVVFDEFQTIEEYPEKMSAVLRSHIQTMGNTRFIFSGSERHMLQSMFKEDNQPFYKSALTMELDIIPEAVYIDFCKRLFASRKKQIDDDTVRFTYNLFGANTLELQQVMNGVFNYTPAGKTANIDYVRYTIEDFLQDNDTYFRELFSNDRSIKERNLLQCIAIEGIATNLTSQEKIQNYYLAAPSSIQSTLERLTTKKNAIIISVGDGGYRLRDKFFELWIADQVGILNQKYATAEKQFRKEREMTKEKPKAAKPKVMPKL